MALEDSYEVIRRTFARRVQELPVGDGFLAFSNLQTAVANVLRSMGLDVVQPPATSIEGGDLLCRIGSLRMIVEVKPGRISEQTLEGLVRFGETSNQIALVHGDETLRKRGEAFVAEHGFPLALLHYRDLVRLSQLAEADPSRKQSIPHLLASHVGNVTPADLETMPRITKGPPRAARLFRDAVWGDIVLTQTEVSCIDTRALQRLRGIQQISLCDLVYPAATHTRFAHALGVLHLAQRFIDQIPALRGVSEFDRGTLRLSALLHDIGQSPLGPVGSCMFELANDRIFSPADLTPIIIRNEGELASILERVTEETAFPGGESESFASEVLSTGVSADLLDYIARDRMFVGLPGSVDLRPLSRMSLVTIGSGATKLVFDGRRLDILSAIGATYLGLARLLDQVYLHRVRLAALSMLGRAARLAVAEGVPLQAPFLLEDNERFVAGYLQVDDRTLLQSVLSAPNDVGLLAQRVLRRQLYKVALDEPLSLESLRRFVSPHSPREYWQRLDALGADIAERANVQPPHVVVDVWGPKLAQDAARMLDSILEQIIDVGGEYVPFGELKQGRELSKNHPQERLVVLCAPEHVRSIADAAKDALTTPSSR